MGNGKVMIMRRGGGSSSGGGDGTRVHHKAYTVTTNGLHHIYPDYPYDGMTDVSLTVDVPTTSKIQGKVTVIPASTMQTIRPAAGYDALSQVVVAEVPLEEISTVKENGTYEASNGRYFKSFTVDVPTGGGASNVQLMNGILYIY